MGKAAASAGDGARAVRRAVGRPCRPRPRKRTNIVEVLRGRQAGPVLVARLVPVRAASLVSDPRRGPRRMNERLNVLVVSPMAPSPPRFGAQARTHGLLSNLANNHDVTAVVLYDDDATPATSGPAMRVYCREVMFVRNPHGVTGWRRRALQVRSWLSSRSYQRHLFAVPALQETLDRLLGSQRFDVVFVNLPYLGHYRLRHAPSGSAVPAVVVDSHDVGYDLARQVARSSAPLGQRLHARFNWRKLAREELAVYNAADGVCVCSTADQKRLAADAPSATT